MGKIKISLIVSDKKANLKVDAFKPDVSDLSTAICQLDLLKINLLSKFAKGSKITLKKEYD